MGWATPRGVTYVVCHGYLGSYPPQPVLVPSTSRRDYIDDVDFPDVVSGTDLLPLPATNTNYIDMYHRHQAG